MSRLYLYVTLALSTAFVSQLDTVQAQRVDAYLSEDSVYVGDRFTLTLIALHGFDEMPSFPSTDSAFGDILPVDLISAGTRFMDADIRLDSAVYEVTTFALDTARLAPLIIGFSGNTVTAVTPARELRVTSMVPQDASGIRDMASPVEFGRPLWPYVFLGLAVLIAAVLIWYMIWRRRQPAPLPVTETEDLDLPSPSAIALERLRALENTPLTKRVQVEAYYVELSDTLRTYVEDRLLIPALESTTTELIRDLVHPNVQHQIPAGIPEQLKQILSLADLVKFADVTPSIPEGRTALEEAVTVVQRIEIKFDQRAASEKFVKAGS